MIEKGRKRGTLRFAVKPEDGATSVALAGSFNNWRPIRMRKQKDGHFVAIVPVSPVATSTSSSWTASGWWTRTTAPGR